MSCCNSSCNHDPCGSSFNQLFTKAAQYAQYTQSQAVAAKESEVAAEAAQAAAEAAAAQVEGFESLYLGAKDVPPAVDNEGNPLQEGALYFNTVIQKMYVWDGTNWITASNVTGFNEATDFLATGTTAPRNLQDRFADVVNVKDFGAVGDGVTDDTAAIQAALNDAAINSNAVFVPSGTYILSNSLIFPNVQGVSMFGPTKSSAGGLNEVSVRLLFSHVGSPAVRLTKDNQCLSNLLIGGFGARTAKNADSIGLLVEGDDTETGSARSCHIYGVTVRDHGGSGFVTSGNTYQTRFDSCTARQNRGHAWVLSGGAFTSRTNNDRVGQVVLKDCRCFDNAGHHILCYDEGYGAYRLIVENFESANYTDYHDATLFVKPAGVVINGENVILSACAFAGGVYDSRTYSSLYISGRVVRSIATRHISAASPAVIVGMDAVKAPADILIDGLFVDQGWTSGDPFVHIETGVRGVTIISRNPDIVTNHASGDLTGTIISTSTRNISRLIQEANKIEISAQAENAIEITRTNSLVGLSLSRTGVGATTGRLDCVGNEFLVGTSTANDVAIQRNSDPARRLTVKSNTINMKTLPTSSAGLVSGDLWNNAGVVNIIP